jgi:hypothetical protein
MELHPFEILKLVGMIGTTNLAIMGIREITGDELSEVLEGRLQQLVSLDKIDYTPIGKTLYECTGVFTGASLFALTGLNPSEVYTTDENGDTVINGNHIVINHLMNSIYSDIYTMINDERDMVKSDPIYKTRFESSNGLPALRYLSNSVVTLDMDEPDTKKLREDMATFKKINAGESQFKVVFYSAVFICNVTLREYIEMELARPTSVTITAHDAINPYAKFPMKDDEDAGDMILTRLYMLPDDYKLDVAVKVNITPNTLAVLGVEAMPKPYHDIYNQILTLIDKAKLISL